MLRGINVGSQKRIKMGELIVLYQSLGFKNVISYLQSGNVIFGTNAEGIKELANIIENKIKQIFGFEVVVLIRTPGELAQIVNDNPFLKGKDTNVDKLYITFLSDTPERPLSNQMKEMRNEQDKFILLNREVYLYCQNGYSKTKFSNDFFENKLRVTATTRNWKTVNALLNMAKNRAG